MILQNSVLILRDEVNCLDCNMVYFCSFERPVPVQMATRKVNLRKSVAVFPFAQFLFSGWPRHRENREYFFFVLLRGKILAHVVKIFFLFTSTNGN